MFGCGPYEISSLCRMNPCCLMKRSANGAAPRGMRRWAVEISWLLESYLYADPSRLDFASTEGARGGEVLELLLRVGAPSEHSQGPSCHKGVHGAQLHRVHLLANRRIRGLFPHVLDDCHSPATQNPVHLVDRLARLTEVLEGRLADDQIEGSFGKRHAGHVALLKVHARSRLPGVLSGDFHERVADIQPGDVEPVESRHRDGEVARTRRHLKHVGAIGQTAGEVGGLLPPLLDLAPGAANLRVPACHAPLHRQPFVAFLSLRRRLHSLHLASTRCLSHPLMFNCPW